MKYYSLQNEQEFHDDLLNYLLDKAIETNLAERTEDIINEYDRDVARCKDLGDWGKNFIEDLIIDHSISGEIYTDFKKLTKILSDCEEKVLIQLDEIDTMIIDNDRIDGEA